MKWFKAPIANVYYTLTLTNKDFKKACKKVGCKPSKFNSDATTNIMYKGSYIYCIVNVARKPCDLDELRALLVHEAVHISERVIEWMNDDSPSEEFKAYTIQSISLDLFKLI